jgi:hypothetical protein
MTNNYRDTKLLPEAKKQLKLYAVENDLTMSEAVLKLIKEGR